VTRLRLAEQPGRLREIVANAVELLFRQLTPRQALPGDIERALLRLSATSGLPHSLDDESDDAAPEDDEHRHEEPPAAEPPAAVMVILIGIELR